MLRRISAAERFVRRGLWPVQGDYPLASKVRLSPNFIQQSSVEILMYCLPYLMAPCPDFIFSFQFFITTSKVVRSTSPINPLITRLAKGHCRNVSPPLPSSLSGSLVVSDMGQGLLQALCPLLPRLLVLHSSTGVVLLFCSSPITRHRPSLLFVLPTRQPLRSS
jgi:hypothetical protein